jgi:hypothetical protein
MVRRDVTVHGGDQALAYRSLVSGGLLEGKNIGDWKEKDVGSQGHVSNKQASSPAEVRN